MVFVIEWFFPECAEHLSNFCLKLDMLIIRCHCAVESKIIVTRPHIRICMSSLVCDNKMKYLILVRQLFFLLKLVNWIARLQMTLMYLINLFGQLIFVATC